MANENIGGRMDHLAEQQALSAARMAEIEDIIVRFAQATRDRFEGTDKQVDVVNEKIAALVDGDLRTQERHHEIDQKIAALVDGDLRTQELHHEIDQKIAALVDSQIRTEESVKETQENFKKTDAALRSLTTVVDRYIAERRNGESKR